MIEIINKVLDEERALYGSNNINVINCKFDGEQDGESALKESSNVIVENSFFNLRYPFWHVNYLSINNSEMTELCRAALWYSNNITIINSKLHGIKALRECNNIRIKDCSIISQEFGWFNNNINMAKTTVKAEYFMMKSNNLEFNNVSLDGKYSFQYIKDSVFENCDFNTKDAFWHAKNVIVRNSTIKGEYLAWYAEDLTFENCKIIGTQPLYYCKNLKLINCEMIDTDLCFEKSDVEATIVNPIISIKNPKSGFIKAPLVHEVIIDDPESKCDLKMFCR